MGIAPNDNEQITDYFNFDDSFDYQKAQSGENQLSKQSVEYQYQHAIIAEEEALHVPKEGADDDIMITDIDKKIIKINDEDEDIDFGPNFAPLYNFKKEIKIDPEDLGNRNYQNRLKRDLSLKNEEIMRDNPLIGNYPCLKRQKLGQNMKMENTLYVSTAENSAHASTKASTIQAH